MNIHKRDLRRWRKAIVSYVLVAALVLGLIPQSAYAAETEAAEKTYTSDGFTITYKESSAWGNYVNAEVTLKNDTDCAKSLWKVTFDYDGEIDSVWNADIISSENGTYVLAAKTYNSTIGAGQSVSFGFMAHGTEGKPSIPESIAFADTAGLDDSGESGDDSGETGIVIPGQSYEIPDEWAGLNYAMFTSGETGLSFYTGTMQVTGSVHTNQDFYYQGGSITIDGTLEAGKSITLKTSDGADAQKIGAKREKAEAIEMPDITKEVSGYVKENGTVYESALDLGSDPVIIDTPVYTGGELTLHATSFLGQGIVYAKDSITVNAGELITPEESRIFLASESGDITLNGSNMSLNAVLYAPNGCVYINTGEFRLNGRIIAKQIVFNGTGLYVEASPDDLDLISFIMPEDMVVPGIKTDACYVRDENGEAHISIENLAQITNETKISEIQYIIYHDANRNDDFSEDECVDIISSREESVPVVLTGVGNYKVVQQILMTDGSVVTTEDHQSAYFEIVNQKPATGLKIEKEAKADILMLYNGLDDAGKEGYQALKEALEKAGEENGVSLSVTQEEIASVHEDFNWISFDHVDYDSHGPHIAGKEDGFVFTSYENDPLKDFVFTETGMGCDQVISFTLQQEQTEATEGCGMIFGASVESTENPECYRNHTYKVIDERKTWQPAKEHCESLGGYLATITGEWEKDYIEEHVLPETRDFIYWLGGYRDEKNTSLWKWVTGEDFYWTHWDEGEPNYLGSGENNLELYGYRQPAGVWNDAYPTACIKYLCEWDGPHMSGYTVLLTDEGMKLIALEDVDMDNVRNGSYARLENAGTLLGTFPYDMKTGEHNITIERNDNVITITDNDEVIVEDFALDVTLKGTGIAPIVSYSRQSQAQEMKECASIGQIKVKELTNRVVQDAVKNHKWEDGAVRYVIHASEAETEEYQSDEYTASLIQYLLENRIHFIGMGQANVMAFTRLDAAVDGTMAQSGDEVSDYMNQSLKEIDREAGGYLTTKDSLVCEAEYRDAEKDPLYRQEWTYDYREGVFSEKEQGEEEQIITEEPITRFDRCGAYHIGLRVQDNPVGENEALSDYRLWSEKTAWDKTLYVHHIPEAAVTAKKEMEENCCHITLSGSGSDEDHRDEEEKGIIKEYYSYKELDDTRWTEGKIPDTVECGKYYLVKYEVEDKEHAKSAPAVACIDTSARRVMDASKDTEAPKAVLHVSSKTALINDVVQITAYATDNYGVKEFALYIDGKKVLSRSGTLQYSCYEEGTVEIIAEAEDFNNNKTVEKAQITVSKEGGMAGDSSYVISGDIKDIVLTENEEEIRIQGSVSGEGHMKKYTLFYKVDDREDMVLIAEGTEEITDGLLGTLKTEDIVSGTYHLMLTVEDTDGNSCTACGSFEYVEGERIDADLNPPVAELTGVKLSEDQKAIEIKASVSDDKELKGYTLSYAPEGGTEYTELAKGTKKLDNEPIAELKTEDLADGTYELRLEAEDTFGNSCTYTMKFTYTKGSERIDTGNGNGEEGTVPTEPVKREFAMNLSYSKAPIGTEVQVQVTLPEDISEETLVIMQDDKELAAGTRKTTFTSDKAGKVTITAIGKDSEGKEKKVTADCTFFNDKDKTAPTAKITSPTIDQVLTEPVDIVGSAYDEEALDFWKLEYRMKGDKDYRLLSEGSEAKKDAVLGRFDTTMLMNGQYEVRLWVQDQGGNITRLENDYVVEGELKVGAMHIGFTDITAPMGGTTVSVNRMYDSRNKRQGDFGIGWTLGISGMEIYENHSIGDGYEMVKTGSLFSTGYQMTETENHDVTITYGDGTSDRFELTFSPERQALVPISEVTLGYRCVTNQKVKLEIVGDTTAEVSGGELLFYDESMYDDLKYKLTTEDGNTIYLNKNKGAYKIADTSGNVITVDENGYHSEDGKNTSFTRDSENRITKATDPAGNTTAYAYDGNGDLISVTDSADRTVSFTYDKEHNLMSITDPMGIAVARNEYDDEGRLTATIDADGNRMEYDYDVEGRTEVVKDRRGNTTVYTYDDNGNVLQTVDAYGNKTTNTYDAHNNLLSTTDAKGNTTAYAYDNSGNVTSVTAADGTTVNSTYTQENYVSGIEMMDKTVMAMAYDSKGRLSTVEDANGNETSYTYASDGKLTGMTDEIGQVQQVTYDKDGNVASTTNGAGESASYTYDKDGRCTSVTISRVENGETLTFTSHYSYNAAGDIVESIDNAGNVTAYEYDQNGNQTASVDARGNRITYAYDDLGNLIKTTYPDGTFETFTYDANGNNITATDRSGLKVTMKYDKLDRMTEKTYADGSKETYTYDAAGNVIETVSASGAKTTYTYDSRNRNTSITDAYGNQTTFTYDEAARLLSSTDALGNTISYDYDDNGNVIRTTYADGNSVTAEYDARNRVISQKDQYGNETGYTYDGADRLTSVTDAYGNSYTYGYDDNGNLVTVTDAKEQVTAYTYDAVGRVASVRNALGKTMEYTYDENGNVTAFKDYAGTTTKYAYDSMNQLVKKTVGSKDITYTYSDTGLLTKVTDAEGSITYAYDRYDRLVSKTDARGVKLSYTYDEVGRLVSFDNGFGTTKYEYDVLDRVTRVIDRNGQATVYEYDALGNRSAVRYPNGNVVTYTYDACQRLKEECIVNGNGVQLSKYSYGIGKAGEKTSVTEVNSGIETEITYQYDKLNRLTKETVKRGDSRLVNEYGYDEVSNRTEKKTTVKGDVSVLADTELDEVEVTEGTTTYTYNALNQLITEVSEGATKTYLYDSNGNLIKQTGDKTVDYSYDKENHLVKATIQKGNSVTIESYTYDYAGNRISKTVNESDTTYYVNDTSSDLSQVVAETGEDGKEKATYTRGDHAELLSMEQNGETWYYLCDGHGSVRILTNEAGRITDRYSYDAYGNLLEKEGDTDNDFLYTGEQYNANTGLYYLRARYMNPSTGTFISMDSYQGSIYDPVTLHKYLYANANPVMYTDPSGYFSLSECSIVTCIQNTINSVHQIRSLTKIIKWANAMCTVYDTAMEIRNVILGGGSIVDVIGALLKGVVVGFMAEKMCKTPLGIILKPMMAIFGLGNQVDQIQEAIKSGDPVKITVRFVQLICMLFGLTSQCFTGDTLVSTEYGLRPIEEIQVGDYVWSENTETGEKELKKVLSVSVTETTVLVHVYTKDGTEVNTTENHPFFVEGKGWCAASELEQGDVLHTQDGSVEIVSDVIIEQLDEAVKVYNLEIEDSHTYYVSDREVLVHNDCGDIAKPEKVVNDLRDYKSSKWNVGGNNILLDKKGLKHILQRHFLNYWDGSTKNKQSFFDKKISINDIKDIVKAIISENREIISERGTNGMYQLTGLFDGIEYVLGINNGRVGQLYPK